MFITNLGKCTQIDARPLPDEVLKKYLDLLFKEINIIKPKIIITFGNQVSSIILNKKICVSENRKKCHKIQINKNEYKVYPVYYPVGNGIFNIDKSIEDIKWIIENEIKKEEYNNEKESNSITNQKLVIDNFLYETRMIENGSD